MHSWKKDDYKDFPYEYQDLAHAVYLAASNLARIRCVATVSLQAELNAQKKIEEAKKADKDGLGIDQISKLKTKTDFFETLVSECGFDEAAAEAEWTRRLTLQDEYEREQEESGDLMIELDVADFKKELEEKRKAEKAAAEILEANRKNIVDAKSNGKIDILQAAIKKAELVEHMSEEELLSPRKLVEDWQRADQALSEACDKKHINMMKVAIQEAEAVGLKNETCKRAKKLLGELIVAEAQARLAAAKELGGIENLKEAIQKAEASMAGISDEGLKAAQTLVQSWEAADLALKEASESKDGVIVKKAVDVAMSLGLRSTNLALAKQVLETISAEDRVVLEAAMSSGRSQVLQDAIAEAEKKSILPEDTMNDARNLLSQQATAEKALSDALSKADLEQLEAALVAARVVKLNDEVIEAAQKSLEAAKAAEFAQQLLESPSAGGEEEKSGGTMELPGEPPRESEDKLAEAPVEASAKDALAANPAESEA